MPENGSVPKEESQEVEQPSTVQYDINNFQLTRILNNNMSRKSVALLGTFPKVSATDEAVLIFEKHPFTESDVQTSEKMPTDSEEASNGNGNGKQSYFSKNINTKTELINDIYGSFQCNHENEMNGLKATVVYPATDKHIAKYSVCKRYLINETPAWYENITLPYITSAQFSLEWVYNILEHKQEAERIVYEDTDPDSGFVLLPDLKWDGHNHENMYLLAIAQKRDIKSLRDLNGEHLALLKNIRDKSANVIDEKYGMSPSELRMYVHYQPSFYHFHVHINPVRNDAPGIWCDKAHLLENVINNLELLSEYYKKATIPFVLYEGHALLDKYEEETTVRKKTNQVQIEKL